MIDQYEANTQVIITALYVVVPAMVLGFAVSKFKRTRTDRRYIIAGLAGIAVSSLLYFAVALSLVQTGECCGMGINEIGLAFFETLRFLSTPFALVSVCFFYRGMASGLIENTLQRLPHY